MANWASGRAKTEATAHDTITDTASTAARAAISSTCNRSTLASTVLAGMVMRSAPIVSPPWRTGTAA